MSVAITAMRGQDIGWAVGLTGKECWGFVRSDFLRIMEHTPGGSFVARLGPRRVGMLTTMCHGRTCWIGNVVVERALRGKGIGKLLVESALNFSALRGIKRTALLSRERTVGFYAGMGFHRDARFVGMSGVPDGSGNHPNVVPVTPALWTGVLALDRKACDEERRRLLRLLARDFAKYFLAYVEKGCVLGFIVGKPGRGLVDVGPWVAVSGRPDVASALFRALASSTGKRLEVYVPRKRRWVLNLLGELGLKPIAGFVEMHRGGRKRPSSARVEMLAVAGLEKG